VCVSLVAIDLVAWSPLENFGFSPIGHPFEGVTLDESLESILGVPFGKYGVGTMIFNLMIKEALDVTRRAIKCARHGLEFVLEFRFFSFYDFIVHTYSDHGLTS
jgi:hypothetical protein